MKLEKISDNAVSAYISKDEMAKLGVTDICDVSALTDVIIGAAAVQFGCGLDRSECEVTSEPGLTVTVRAKKRRPPVKTAILCFDDGRALYDAAVFLCDKCVISSRLMRGRGGDRTYYLILEYRADGEPLWLSAVSELAVCAYREKNSFFYYISEHCDAVFEKNAINVIANSDKTW